MTVLKFRNRINGGALHCPEDDARDAVLLAALELVWPWKLEQCRVPAPYDAHAFERETGALVGVVELKRTRVTVGHYPAFLLDFYRVEALERLSVPARLVVEYADAVAWIRVAEIKAVSGPATRRLVGQPRARELGLYPHAVYRIPVAAMQRLPLDPRQFRRSPLRSACEDPPSSTERKP